MIAVADATKLPLRDKAVDLVFGSPPYCDARTYGIGFSLKCEEWVNWMLDVTSEALRVCKGPVIWVAAGVTRDRCYWPACEGLMWEWWKRGGSMYRPCAWIRQGIPGSGGTDWFRADWEFVMCFKRPGELPWSDNTACGHTPTHEPGGPTSHRNQNGTRITRLATRRNPDGTRARQQYSPPTLANPGNTIRTIGGHVGDSLGHDAEAPFPEKLAERFVLSCCPPGGIVCDPFSGSGTTKAVAQQHGRRAIAFDIRMSQCVLTRRRTAETQLSFAALEASDAVV